MVVYDERTALIVVDVQNDFADPNGSLSVAGGEEIIPAVNREVRAAAGAGALVVYTQDWHPPDTPHFARNGGRWPDHCLIGSWGAELHPALEVAGSRVKVGDEGEGYSGFEGEDLDRLLADRAVENVVVAGLATDYCVKATAIDAAERGFHTVLLREGVRAVDLESGDGERAVEAMRAAGVEVS